MIMTPGYDMIKNCGPPNFNKFYDSDGKTYLFGTSLSANQDIMNNKIISQYYADGQGYKDIEFVSGQIESDNVVIDAEFSHDTDVIGDVLKDSFRIPNEFKIFYSKDEIKDYVLKNIEKTQSICNIQVINEIETDNEIKYKFSWINEDTLLQTIYDVVVNKEKIQEEMYNARVQSKEI